ncbi:MAG: neuraminidase-like domain-containing protein, partial [Ilumatobacteraceae bacterium]
TMETLFGSMDFCECDHCGSVLGPAAYLVDLLKFLDPDESVWQGFLSDWQRRHDGESYPWGTPYDELMARRPDLAHLALTCDNTNIVLPTIDLVNEILEFLLANGSLTAQAAHDSGGLSSAQVLTEPEFIEAAVYDDVLRTSTCPQILPFDLWHETVRAYTDWFEAPLTRLVELFGPTGVEGTFAVAAERLGLTSVEAAVITADNPMDSWWTRFGFDDEATALAQLARAKPLSQALGVSYQGLVDLLGSSYANPGLRDLTVLTTAGVSVADAVTWRQNQAMLALADPPTGAGDLRTWTTVRSTQRRLDTVTTQWGLTGPRAADAWLLAIADDVFNSVVVLLDPDASCSFELTTVGAAGTGAPLADATFAQLLVQLDLFVRLQRRLGWTTAELDTALAAFVPGGATAPAMFGAPMRTAVVYLARQQQLAQLLDYDGDRRRLTALWAELDPALHKVLFVERPAQERDAAMAAPLGDILSTDNVGTGDAAAFAAHLPVLQSGLRLTAAEIAEVLAAEGVDPTTEPLSEGLVAALHRHAVLAAGLGWSVADVLALRRLSGIDPFLPLAAGPLAAPEDDQIDAATLRFATLARSIDASRLGVAEIDLLAAGRFDPEGELRPDLDALSDLLDAVATTLAGAAPDQPDTTPRLVNQIAAATGQPPGLLFTLLTTESGLRDPATPDDPAPLIEAYLTLTDAAADRTRATNAHLLLTRVLMLADRLRLDDGEIAEFDLSGLPVVPVDGVAPHFGEVMRLLSYHALRGDAVGGSGSLLGVLQAARPPAAGPAPDEADLRGAALAAFAQLTRRDVATATAVADVVALDATALGTVAGLERLWEAAALVSRVGVRPDALAAWPAIVAPTTTAETRHRIVREVKDAVRSHGPTEVWMRVAKPINDRLRQRKRDALVAASLVRLGLTTTEQLYERLLIDPGSEPVLQTSRIRAAISSLQLFVQRCLLNIEPRVHPSAVNRDHWTWMKRYR